MSVQTLSGFVTNTPNQPLVSVSKDIRFSPTSFGKSFYPITKELDNFVNQKKLHLLEKARAVAFAVSFVFLGAMIVCLAGGTIAFAGGISAPAGAALIGAAPFLLLGATVSILLAVALDDEINRIKEDSK